MLTATKGGKINISEEKDTKSVAEKFSKLIKQGDFILLSGNLGVGKTTFIKYIIQEFQKKNKLKQTEVTSPTFNLLNEYKIKEIKINHYDLFRLKSNEEVKNLDLFIDTKNSITLIEWPQIIKEKPRNLIEFIFEYKDNHEKRFLNIKGLDF